MKNLLLVLLFVFSFSACENKENEAKLQAEHDAKIAAQARADLLAELKAKEEEKIQAQKNSKLNQMGINMNNGTITIDANKTKDFFNSLNKKMEKEMKKISEDLQKGVVNAAEEGIKINENEINIDLNKTRKFLEIWGEKIQVFAKEFDNVAKSLDINTSKGI